MTDLTGTFEYAGVHRGTREYFQVLNLQTKQAPNQKSNPNQPEQKMQNECCCSIRQRKNGSITSYETFFPNLLTRLKKLKLTSNEQPKSK